MEKNNSENKIANDSIYRTNFDNIIIKSIMKDKVLKKYDKKLDKNKPLNETELENARKIFDNYVEQVNNSKGASNEIKTEYINKINKVRIGLQENQKQVEQVISEQSLETSNPEINVSNLNLASDNNSTISAETSEELQSEPTLETSNPEINASNVNLASDRNSTISAETNEKLRKKKKRIVLAGIGISALLVAGGCFLSKAMDSNSSTQEKSAEKTTEEKVTDYIKVLKPTLSFDTEDTNKLIENMKSFIIDWLPKGYELTDKELERQVETLTHYYIVMNIDEIGPTYLSSLFQSDSVTTMEILMDYISVATTIRYDAITSSMENGTVLDMTNVVSNNVEKEKLQETLNNLGKLSDAVMANDEALVKSIVKEAQESYTNFLLQHTSYSYSSGFLDSMFRLGFSYTNLLQHFDIEFMTDDMESIIYYDEKLTACYESVQATEDISKMTIKEVETSLQSSKKSDNLFTLISVIADKLDKMNILSSYEGAISISQVMIDVSEYIRNNDILSKSVSNMDLEEWVWIIRNQRFPQTNTVDSLPEGTIIGNNGQENIYVDGPSYGATNQKDYENKVKDNFNQSNPSNAKDTEGNVVYENTNLNKTRVYEYALSHALSSGYTAGNKVGATGSQATTNYDFSTITSSNLLEQLKGNNKASVVEALAALTDSQVLEVINGMTSALQETYGKGYVQGYNDGYAVYKNAIENSSNQNSITNITPQEQSSSVSDSKTYSQPELSTNNQSSIKGTESSKGYDLGYEQSEITYINPKEVNTGTVVEQGLVGEASNVQTEKFDFDVWLNSASQEQLNNFSEYMKAISNIQEEATISRTK